MFITPVYSAKEPKPEVPVTTATAPEITQQPETMPPSPETQAPTEPPKETEAPGTQPPEQTEEPGEVSKPPTRVNV